MCEINNKLKFCTCLEEKDIKLIELHKSLEKFQKKQIPGSKEPFSWVLFEYKGFEASDIMGLLKMPSDKIGFYLTEEFVLQQLNLTDCFDFDYKPKEGDNLQVHFQDNKYSAEFLSFIYRDENWEADSYYTFTEKIEPKNYGILKVEK